MAKIRIKLSSKSRAPLAQETTPPVDPATPQARGAFPTAPNIDRPDMQTEEGREEFLRQQKNVPWQLATVTPHSEGRTLRRSSHAQKLHELKERYGKMSTALQFMVSDD